MKELQTKIRLTTDIKQSLKLAELRHEILPHAYSAKTAIHAILTEYHKLINLKICVNCGTKSTEKADFVQCCPEMEMIQLDKFIKQKTA